MPALAVAGVYVALAYGFARRSRIAYVVGLLLSLWTLTGMTWVLVSDARFGATVIPYAIGLPALLMGVGLGMAWRPFWQRSRGAEPNNR